MALSLLCPGCKSLLPLTVPEPKPGITVGAFCSKCGKDVGALVVELSASKKSWKLASPEPREKDKEEARELASIVPAGGALFVLGNSVEVAKFVVMRLITFGLLALVLGDRFAIDLKNPYFLAAASCVLLVLAHILYLTVGRMNQSRVMTDLIMMGLVAIALPVITLLVIGELLLAFINPLFLVLDLALCWILILVRDEFAGRR